MFSNPSRASKARSGHKDFGNYCAKVEIASPMVLYMNIARINLRQAEKNSEAENLALHYPCIQVQ